MSIGISDVSNTSGSRTRKLGELTLGLARSTNEKTSDKLVWAARNSTGVPVLVHVMKALTYSDWGNAKWTVVRKGAGTYPQSAKLAWQVLDRRRLLMVGSHHAVFEVVLPEPTINEETKAFFPIRLKCDVVGLEILSKPFFVLSTDSIGNVTKLSLAKLDEWFLDPNMGLTSVVQQSVVRIKSLGAAFLRRHTSAGGTMDEEGAVEPGTVSASRNVFIADEETHGVRAKFVGVGNAVVRAIEKVYPVPVPMDDAHLLIAVSQIFHFTHESIHWVGDQTNTEMLFAYNAAMLPNVYSDFGTDKLHVYGSIVPLKGMYQHSNPRLKIPFEVLCNTLKVILASNGLPKRWLENDGRVIDMTDAQVKERKFFTYEAIFGPETQGASSGAIFNVNKALEALSKSVSVNRNGALCIDYSVVVPVLVNTLSELHALFSGLTKSRLRSMIGDCTEQLFGVQAVVSEIGAEVAAMHEERAVNEHTLVLDGGLVFRYLSSALRDLYATLPLHLTQTAEMDFFTSPAFDLFETSAEKEESTGTTLDFAELIQSDLTVCRICVRGPPGSGKTTLGRYIAREWARNRVVFSGKYEVIIMLSLDAATTPAYADLQQVTLVDLVFREIVQHSSELRELVGAKDDLASWLVANNHRILWILDGVDALERFVENPYNAVKATSSSSKSPGASPPSKVVAGDGEHNVKDLLRMLESSADLDAIMKHRIITTDLGRSTKIVADLYLSLRPFDNGRIREYLSRVFPSSEESGTDQELSADLEEQVQRIDSNEKAPAILSTRATKIWLSLEKNKLLARDWLHNPLNLELVCQSYLSDPRFHLLPEHSSADLFGRFYQWLVRASGPAEAIEPLEKFVQKLAYSSMFKSKFASPTLVSKMVNQIPREFRAVSVGTRFFESASRAGKGARFIHCRMTEYLTARYLADPGEDRFGVELLSRLKAKVINRSYHSIFFFLVGMVRNDRPKRDKLFDIVLIDERELGILGMHGPSFVFKCFEETGFDRSVRARVIEWFWARFGKPRMAIWRSSFVMNLLELIMFKLTKKSASEEEAMDQKRRVVRALGSMGVESQRVVQMLIRAYDTYPTLLPDVVLSVHEIGSTSLSVIPLLFEALKSRDHEQLKVAIAETRRMIVPSAIEKSSGGSKTVDAAAGKLVKIGMDWIEKSGADAFHLVREVLTTLDQWKWGDDRMLPLLVMSLEHEDVDVVRSAISALRWVNLGGPNVYYNDKLVGLLETIGRREPRMRVEVASTLLFLQMDAEFAQELLVTSLSQSEDTRLRVRMMLLCAQFHLKIPRVLEALAALAGGVDQEIRRHAIDVLAYIFLPRFDNEPEGSRTSAEEIQQHINSVVDTLYTLGLSSQFVTHRVVRMADKKSKSGHMDFAGFAVKYF